MTIPQRIHEYLTSRTPARFCDDCIAKEAEIAQRQDVNPITGVLGLTTDFEKIRGTCSLCKHDEKLVTRSLRYG
jgi:hypothetical protein